MMADIDDYPRPNPDADRPNSICLNVLKDATYAADGRVVPCKHATQRGGCRCGLHPYGLHDPTLKDYPNAYGALMDVLSNCKMAFRMNYTTAGAFDITYDDLSDPLKRANSKFPNNGNQRTPPSTKLPDSASGGGGGGGSEKDASKPVKMNRSVMLATVKGACNAEVYAAIASLPEDEQYDQCVVVMQQAWNDPKGS